MKAVFVIDMPDGCGDCDLSNSVHGCYENCLNQNFAKEDEDYYTRPSWCSLRPLSERNDYEPNDDHAYSKAEIMAYTYGIVVGRNQIIDEITGETE